MNYYQLLGVESKASQKAIKYAYKQLALKYHPDKNQGDSTAETRFKEINNAYQILSNPQKRALYDNKISYDAFEKTYTDPYGQYRYATYQKTRQQYYQRARKFNFERNRIANLWTVGIVASITMVFLIISWINSYVDQQEKNRLLAIDQATLNAAHQKYKAGVYNEALVILENHLKDNGNRESIKELKNIYLKELTSMANQDFSLKRYEDALRSFKIIFNFQENLPLDFYNKVAKSSRYVGNYDDAVNAYQHIANKMPAEIEPNLQIALIYTYNLKQYDKALKHFQLAKEVTIRNYIKEYGKAFVLVFDPEDIPENHYFLYSGLGFAAIHNDQYSEATEALEWAIILRPNRPEAYYVLGQMYRETGNDELACENWLVASQLGLEEASRLVSINCVP